MIYNIIPICVCFVVDVLLIAVILFLLLEFSLTCIFICCEKPFCNLCLICALTIILFIILCGIPYLPFYIILLPFEICCISPEVIAFSTLIIITFLFIIGCILVNVLMCISPLLVLCLFLEICIIALIWTFAYLLTCGTFALVCGI